MPNRDLVTVAPATTDDTAWVCRHCGSDEIAALSMVPRSQGTGPLIGATLDAALDECSWDDGHDECYWEFEERTGYQCRGCDAEVTEKEGLAALVVPA